MLKLYKTKTTVVLSLFILVFVSCQSIPQEHKGAAVGAGAGAVGGAILGEQTGLGTVAGGLLGALVGGAIGHYAYDQRQGREQTVNQYNYDPAQGPSLQIESVNVQPNAIQPGGTVDMVMTYAVLTPNSDQALSITEKREIYHNSQLVGDPKATVQHKGGTYRSSIPITLPNNADPGTYQVRYIVSTGSMQKVQEGTFTVQ